MSDRDFWLIFRRALLMVIRAIEFQSTPPMREATAKYGAINSNPPIGGDNHKKQ